jgi:predicted small secreted protein
MIGKIFLVACGNQADATLSCPKEKSIMRKLLVLILISTLFLAGCGCISGFGRDMQKAGRWLEQRGGN